MSLPICQKCLCGRTGDVAGEPCKTEGCDGILEIPPAYADLVDPLPGTHDCPRRQENPHSLFPGPDHWDQFKSNGDRVCSYCGSLHPDDFWRLVREAAEAGPDADYNTAVQIEPSTKHYKVYVRRATVRNAHEGGIKFYTQHLDFASITDEQDALYKQAARVSQQRFDKWLARLRYGK